MKTKEYVQIRTIHNGHDTLPLAILYKDHHYTITEVLKSSFFQGITTFEVLIGKKHARIFRDDYINRWYVMKKAA